MKRISFKDSGGLNLTQAVLSGRKTMTRRVAYTGKIENLNTGFFTEGKDKGRLALLESNFVVAKSQYGKGEIVAIQQAYKDIPPLDLYSSSYGKYAFERSAGWTNKMFVAARFMPHHIRITDVRVERLQDISNKDCLREGVYKDTDGGRVIGYPFGVPFYYTFNGAISKDGKNLYWVTPREAFAALIDKVNGRGTWDSNPLVWAYSFELVD